MSLMFVLVDGPSTPRGPERQAVVKVTPSEAGWRLSLRWAETGRAILRYVGDEPRLLVESFMLWCSMHQINWVADREGVDPQRIMDRAPDIMPLYPPPQVRSAAERLLENLPQTRPAEDPRIALRPKIEGAPQARPVAQPQSVAPAPIPAPILASPDGASEEEAEFDRFLIKIARARKAGMPREDALMAMHAFSDEALEEEYVEDEGEEESEENEYVEEGEGQISDPPLTMTMAPGSVATVALARPAILRPARADELPLEMAALRDPRAEEKMRRTMERTAQASRIAQEGAAAAESQRGRVAVVKEEVIKKRSLEETLAEAEAGIAEANALRAKYEATNAPLEISEAEVATNDTPKPKRKRAPKKASGS